MARRWQDGRGMLVVHGDRGEVAVPLEIAASYRARTKGLLGRDQQRAHQGKLPGVCAGGAG